MGLLRRNNTLNTSELVQVEPVQTPAIDFVIQNETVSIYVHNYAQCLVFISFLKLITS